jgi:hypothetical protein
MQGWMPGKHPFVKPDPASRPTPLRDPASTPLLTFSLLPEGEGLGMRGIGIYIM